MAIFKCKMCGGTLEIDNETVAVCQYCGTKQTLPKLDDDRKANLYDRANHFRRNNEFDKAMGIYEQILNDDNTDAESYWSLVLCRYGIEYVEDPTSHKRIPTVNRAQFTSIFDDEDYKSALQYADGYQKELYEQEATVINNIQKGILAISGQEEPFDVFICYKESDANGRRTPDSVLATELYHELTREGYKVFFSRITLEDKLGQEYEPYIFAALNSAKVMVVLGTKPEYFNAVWVKNEWGRYLALIKNGARKMLIPAYKDMDPYDLPEEFSHLQAQDMSKLGFMQDLIHGVRKMVKRNAEKPTVYETVISNEVTSNVAALLKRGFLALEDGEWVKADDFFEQSLNHNAELAEAYLGKLMAELQVKTQDSLKDHSKSFEDSTNYQKAVRFANETLKKDLVECAKQVADRIENERLENLYQQAVAKMDTAKNAGDYQKAAAVFQELSPYKDVNAKCEQCFAKAEEKTKEEEQRKKIRRKRIKKLVVGLYAIIPITAACIVLLETVILPELHYRSAQDAFENKDYTAAYALFKDLNGYRDSEQQLLETQYQNGLILLKNGNYEEARTVFSELGDYKDSKEQFSKVHQTIINFKLSSIAKATVGQHIFLADKYNPWLVLDKKDNKVLLLGDLVNSRDEGGIGDMLAGSWGNSTLRTYLNGSFLSEQFAPDIAERILVTKVENPTNSSDITEDKVFILSKKETQQYTAKGLNLTADNEYILRDVNNDFCIVATTQKNKYKKYEDNDDNDDAVSAYFLCVLIPRARPAMWIDISGIE